MVDGILKTLLCDGEVAACIISCKSAVEQARIFHNTSPEATIALGRTMVAGALMSQTLKNKTEKLSLIINGDGAAGKIIVTVGKNGVFKGYIQNPCAQSVLTAEGKLSVSEIVGRDGTVTVIRDEGFGDPYVGISKIVSGEIGEDIASYYMQSEQQQTAVLLGVKINRDLSVANAGGLLITPLPNCSEKALFELKNKVESMPPISEMLEKYLTLEELAHDQFWDIGVKPLQENDIQYRCDCSFERMLSALAAINRNEIEEMIAEGESIEMNCHFCNKKYKIELETLKSLLKDE